MIKTTTDVSGGVRCIKLETGWLFIAQTQVQKYKNGAFADIWCRFVLVYEWIVRWWERIPVILWLVLIEMEGILNGVYQWESPWILVF